MKNLNETNKVAGNLGFQSLKGKSIHMETKGRFFRPQTSKEPQQNATFTFPSVEQTFVIFLWASKDRGDYRQK